MSTITSDLIGGRPTRSFDAAAAGPRASGYSYVVAVMLGVVMAFNYMDRQLLSILAEPIRTELQLTDLQLGALTGLAFALFYTTFGIPIAWLADRYNRVRIVAAACTVWSLFSLLTGFARNFAELAIMRVGVGAGEAGGSPPSYSLIADYFPRRQRGIGLAIFTLGIPIGAIIGTTLGAGIAARYGWRTSFLVIGAAGIVVALITLLVLREPRRGAMEDPNADPAAPGENKSILGTISDFTKNPVLVWTSIGATLSAFCSYGVTSWAPAFLIRERAMTLSEIAIFYGIITGVAGMIGTVLAGVLVDRLSRRTPAAYALVPMGAFILALPLFVGFLLSPTWPWAIAFLTLPALFLNAWLTPALAVIQNTAPLDQRSTSAALMLFLMNMLGFGLGPVLVGAVSDSAKAGYADSSLQIGMLALVPFFALTIFAHFMAARAISRRARASAD